MAAAEEDVRDPVAALPPPLALRVFALLPLDIRLRCAEVCRAWHKALADRSLWAELDLTQLTCGVAPTAALLCAATKRAAGSLQTLRLPDFGLPHATLCGIAAANAALRELRLERSTVYFAHTFDDLEEVLRAAPQLRLLETDVRGCRAAGAQRVLRREPPFGALSVRRLEVVFGNNADTASVLADLTASTAPITGLRLCHATLNDQAALDAVVDAALARSLSLVELFGCSLSPASAPALARLLRSGTLTQLSVRGGQLLDEPAAAVLGAALHASSSLTSLSLAHVGLWSNAAVAIALLDAVTAHPSLQTLDFDSNGPCDFDAQVAAGAALNALLLEDTPALQTLRVKDCDLGDAGLGPLFDALPHNTHLRTLVCKGNRSGDAFARERLLPAVRANASLRELRADYYFVAAREAMELVARRPDAAGANYP